MEKLLLRTPFCLAARSWARRLLEKNDYQKWVQGGRSAPPPRAFKEEVVKEYAQRYGLKTFVETGTYYGDMVEAAKGCFSRIFSIELSKRLSEIAKKRFRSEAHIRIIRGDSAEKLAGIVREVTGPALFWLDAHYSCGVTARGVEETPVLEELKIILRGGNPQHVILIDDAHSFGVQPGYPAISRLREFARGIRSDIEVTAEDGIIRIVPVREGTSPSSTIDLPEIIV